MRLGLFHARIQKVLSGGGGGPDKVIVINLQRVIQTSLKSSSNGSLPEFRRKPMSNCEFPVGGDGWSPGPDHCLPLWIHPCV